jgi:hypothetical protein
VALAEGLNTLSFEATGSGGPLIDGLRVEEGAVPSQSLLADPLLAVEVVGGQIVLAGVLGAELELDVLGSPQVVEGPFGAEDALLFGAADALVLGGEPDQLRSPAHACEPWSLVASAWVPSFAEQVTQSYQQRGEFLLPAGTALPHNQVLFECGSADDAVVVKRFLQLDHTLAHLGDALAGGFEELILEGDSAKRPTILKGDTLSEQHYFAGGAPDRFIIRVGDVHCAQDYSAVGGENDNPVLGQWGRIWARECSQFDAGAWPELQSDGGDGITAASEGDDDPLSLGSQWSLDLQFKTPFPGDGFHTLVRGLGGDSEPVSVAPATAAGLPDDDALEGAGLSLHSAAAFDVSALGTVGSFDGNGFNSAGVDISVLSAGWHQLTVVSRGDGQTLFYLDDELASSFAAVQPLVIRAVGNWFNPAQVAGGYAAPWGYLYRLQVFDFALTPDLVSKLRTVPVPPPALELQPIGRQIVATGTAARSISIEGSPEVSDDAITFAAGDRLTLSEPIDITDEGWSVDLTFRAPTGEQLPLRTLLASSAAAGLADRLLTMSLMTDAAHGSQVEIGTWDRGTARFLSSTLSVSGAVENSCPGNLGYNNDGENLGDATLQANTCACNDKCEATQECTGWVFATPALGGVNCWLKRTYGSDQHNSGCGQSLCTTAAKGRYGVSTWHRLTVVANGDTKFYINDAEAKSHGSAVLSDLAVIGNGGTAVDEPFGTLGHLAFWDSALSPQQVQSLRSDYVVPWHAKPSRPPPVIPPPLLAVTVDADGDLVNTGSSRVGLSLQGSPDFNNGPHGGSDGICFGPSDVMQLASAIPLGSTWTIDTWIRLPLPNMNQWHALTRGESGGYTAIVRQESDGTMRLGSYCDGDSCATNFYDSGMKLDFAGFPTGWHRLTIIADHGTTQFYLNDMSPSSHATVIDTDVFTIGNYIGGTEPFGCLAGFMLWGSAMKSEQIALIRTVPVARPLLTVRATPSGAVALGGKMGSSGFTVIGTVDTVSGPTTDSRGLVFTEGSVLMLGAAVSLSTEWTVDFAFQTPLPITGKIHCLLMAHAGQCIGSTPVPGFELGMFSSTGDFRGSGIRLSRAARRMAPRHLRPEQRGRYVVP